ncbi:hypothetical protein [Dyella sp. 2RAB6]|uniref:hypothetical protein n=1 Tax=Dyella sp. 2RAB6 TaxID=3232992 RepID=UPI003F8FFC50
MPSSVFMALLFVTTHGKRHFHQLVLIARIMLAAAAAYAGLTLFGDESNPRDMPSLLVAIGACLAVLSATLLPRR